MLLVVLDIFESAFFPVVRVCAYVSEKIAFIIDRFIQCMLVLSYVMLEYMHVG